MADRVPGREPVDYVCERVRQALAHDGRVGNLSLSVRAVGGRLFVGGAVATEQRRQAVSDVAAAAADGLEVVNEVEVVALGTPAERETLA